MITLKFIGKLAPQLGYRKQSNQKTGHNKGTKRSGMHAYREEGPTTIPSRCLSALTSAKVPSE